MNQCCNISPNVIFQKWVVRGTGIRGTGVQGNAIRGKVAQPIFYELKLQIMSERLVWINLP